MNVRLRQPADGMIAATLEAVMQQLLYAGSTSRDISAEQRDAILAKSQRNNRKRGVTGMLLYAETGLAKKSVASG
jgi:hypothetical protein